MNEWMNTVWINEWIYEWILNEWMNEWKLNEWILNEWMNTVWINEWIYEWILNEWMKSCRENQNANVIFNYCFRKSYRLWENVEKLVQPDRPQMTISRMRSAYCITKATNTHSEHVIRYGTMLQTENSLRFISKTLSSGEYLSQTSLLVHL